MASPHGSTATAGNLSADDVRGAFLRYFEERGHRVVRSSPLVPQNDPTLLFANAGMNQFKDVFLGKETRDYQRATSSQKCVRAGGKHNDLENVGLTARHHTFFEMLGNFSFGDYFKKDAIAYAWEFLTRELSLPAQKLTVTVFRGEDGVPRDAEAHELWQAHVPGDRVLELGARDNFWAMGDTGPCGPCSEIHFDFGIKPDCTNAQCDPSCGCGRWLEIWNLVFMQFNRDASGKLTPLPKPSIDTGAGLERILALLQGVDSVWETDLMLPMVERACSLTGTSYVVGDYEHRESFALRVLAEHARSSAMLVNDGVFPSNEARGYVLRRIIRRAVRYAFLLGTDKLPTNQGVLVGSYASVARMLDELSEVPGVRGVMLTFDDFVIGMEQFGTRIMPLMRCLDKAKKAA